MIELDVAHLYNCEVCLANNGVERINPGPTIYKSTHWLVEHIYPCPSLGWLVIPTRRHVESLSELSGQEWMELGGILQRSSELLRAALDYEKEYLISLYEAERSKHVHVHYVAKPHNVPPELKGPKIFEWRRTQPTLPEKDIIEFCGYMKERF